MDPKVNGQLQKEWGLLIAVYLFLGGVGSGAYVLAAVHSLLGDPLALGTVTRLPGDSTGLLTAIGLWIGFPALAVGSCALLADLGSPAKAIKAGLKIGTSWMARGFWIISIFMVVAFVHLVLHFYVDMSANPQVLDILSAVGIVFGLLTMAYTGILLGVSKGIPFWRSGVVPVVFVVSALVTGHFTIILGVVGHGGPSALELLQTMALEAVGLVILEILAIVFFIQAAYKSPDARESVERMMAKQSFVIGYVLLGLLLPAVLMGLLYFAMAELDMQIAYIIAGAGALFGLAGGLILRQSVLVSGTLPTLNVAGFQFRRAGRPKEPKPDIGMMPPV